MTDKGKQSPLQRGGSVFLCKKAPFFFIVDALFKDLKIAQATVRGSNIKVPNRQHLLIKQSLPQSLSVQSAGLCVREECLGL